MKVFSSPTHSSQFSGYFLISWIFFSVDLIYGRFFFFFSFPDYIFTKSAFYTRVAKPIISIVYRESFFLFFLPKPYNQRERFLNYIAINYEPLDRFFGTIPLTENRRSLFRYVLIGFRFFLHSIFVFRRINHLFQLHFYSNKEYLWQPYFFIDLEN